MSVAVTLAGTLTVVETLASNMPGATDANSKVTHNVFNATDTVTPATTCAFWEEVLSSGTATVDLTALEGSNSGAIDGSTLKVQAIMMKAPAANGAVITISVGAANGYDLLGAGMSIALLPGQWTLTFLYDASPDIAAGDKTIDLAGTGSADLIQFGVVMG